MKISPKSLHGLGFTPTQWTKECRCWRSCGSWRPQRISPKTWLFNTGFWMDPFCAAKWCVYIYVYTYILYIKCIHFNARSQQISGWIWLTQCNFLFWFSIYQNLSVQISHLFGFRSIFSSSKTSDVSYPLIWGFWGSKSLLSFRKIDHPWRPLSLPQYHRVGLLLKLPPEIPPDKTKPFSIWSLCILPVCYSLV